MLYILDMLVGDWDRHGDQWRWARRREGALTVYAALPGDRDQAFARFDGFFPRIAEIASPQMEYFSEDLDVVECLMLKRKIRLHSGGFPNTFLNTGVWVLESGREAVEAHGSVTR